MKVKTLATSGIIAALYVAVTFLIAPFGFTLVQFRFRRCSIISSFSIRNIFSVL